MRPFENLTTAAGTLSPLDKALEWRPTSDDFADLPVIRFHE
jgi:hypothetical protein